MNVESDESELRVRDLFHHIDPGFVNRRLCMTALSAKGREYYADNMQPGGDHMSILRNDHLLITMILDICKICKAPTLLEALSDPKSTQVFCSTERVYACRDVRKNNARVKQKVKLDIDFGKPVFLEYHTEHLVSSTGTMTLASGYTGGVR